MGRMLGAATRKARRLPSWAFCCVGHDGRWKDYIRTKRKAQRAKERREWQREERRREDGR